VPMQQSWDAQNTTVIAVAFDCGWVQSVNTTGWNVLTQLPCQKQRGADLG
jgi:hypothetical protein